ncbi:LOB domain-containing protein 4 [Striga hermonthica]|uniref:LOB domain-containing protein 4 n=2 Tax=Striga TaxID=4169 RepID=A0A9N7NFF9_STRHE|nr:LOB domain-containing protein [Striga asiatica]CAA0833445.1 LOB domain-containing protein 4 [Striga hermonthica]
MRKSESSRKHGIAPPCAACKLLRRRCAEDCVFAPYFPADEPHKFASVHKVFGASNVNKMLQELPEHQRGDAVSSLVYEANARVRDPVYGCVGAISSLQNQIDTLQTQLALAQAEIVQMRMRQFSYNSPDNASPSSRDGLSYRAGSHFNMDMDMMVDQANLEDSFWH